MSIVNNIHTVSIMDVVSFSFRFFLSFSLNALDNDKNNINVNSIPSRATPKRFTLHQNLAPERNVFVTDELFFVIYFILDKKKDLGDMCHNRIK